MAVGDIWEFTLRYELLGQECLNVFGYEVTTDLDSTVSGNDLARWFGDTITPLLQPLLANDTIFRQVDAIQVTGGAGIGSYSLGNVTGEDISQPLPSSVALGFRLNRASSLSRHGYKRFAGLSEDKVDGNTLTFSAGWDTNLIAFLVGDLDDPTSAEAGVLTPRIVSRIVNKQPRPTPVAFPISSVTSLGVTSQNTRKP